MTRYALLAIAVTLAGCGPRELTGERHHETTSVPLDQSEVTRVELRMGAGELHVVGGATELMAAEFDYNVDSWKPEVEYHSTGTRSDLVVRQPEGHFGAPGADNRWDLRLNDRVEMDVVAHLGAGEADLNLSSLTLRNVEVNMGVGEVRVDLRGMPRQSYDVRINGGVGQATVYLPAGVGINATASGGIGSIEASGLENRNGRWINARMEDSPVTIRVDVRGGIGEIRLVAE